MINSLIRKKLKGSIKRKIIIGFSILLFLLSIVSFIGIRGISHLNKINKSTTAVRDVLDLIYKMRLSEKNLVIDEDTLLTSYIDSLTNKLNNIILDINQNKLHEKTIALLDPLLEYISDFNKNYKIYIQLISTKKELEAELDSFFYTVDRVKNSSRMTIDNWLRAHPKEPLTVLSDLNKIQSNIIKARYEIKKVGLTTNFKTLLDSLSFSFDQMYAYTYVLERSVGSKELKKNVVKLRNGLRNYEQTLMRYVQLIQDMMVIITDLRESGRKMQDVARKASEAQVDQQLYWSNLGLHMLIVIVLMSIFGGGAIFIFFFRRIMVDEKRRERIEEEIEENRRLLDDIISNSISLIYVKTIEGKYSLVNQNWRKQMNIADNVEVVGHYDHEFFPKEQVDRWRETDLKVIQHNKPLISEEEFVNGDTKKYYLSNKFPIHDNEGNTLAVCGMSTDITDLKSALNELERSRESYRNIVSNVPGIVYNCKYDDSRTMIFLSSGFEKITGFSRVNFIEGIQTFTNLIIPEDRENVIETIRTAVSRNQSFEVEYRVEDAEGNVRWLHEKGMAINKSGTKDIILQGVIIDVTGQMHAIQEVMVRDRFLQGVAEAVRELLIGTDTFEAISKSLRIVGCSAMVDSAFIFKNETGKHSSEIYTSHLFEWKKDSIDPVKRDDLQMLRYEDLATRWYFILRDKNLISGDRNDFVKEERKLFQWLELESLLLVPIFTKDEFWGFIGFGMSDDKMEWTDSLKAIFKAYAVTLGIIISKEMDASLLKEAKESAEAATKMKSDFLARMSHEIRTPMNAIVGWTHLAIEKSRDDANIEYLKRIQSGSKSLLGIINDILDFSKIEAGKLSIEEIPFDLEKVFSDMSDMVSFRVFKKGIEYAYNIYPDVPLNLIGDPLRIGQILINLVNNAVKFTDEGYVVASVKVKNRYYSQVELLFEVKDTGIGIKPQYSKELFDSFTQADVSTTRKFGGTGLGLAICKRLTGLMHGKIWVESEFGVGSKFKFILPLKVQEKQKDEQLIMPEDIKNKGVLIGLFNTETQKILVEMLDKFHFTHETAKTPEEIKNKLAVASVSVSYAFVIIDWPVYDKNSEKIIADIVKSCRKKKLPVIVTSSAFYESKKLDNLVRKNDVWLLNKPFNYSSLYDVIMLAYGKEGTKSNLYKGSVPHFMDELRSIRDVKVLLVEDNEANQQIGTEMLGLAGVSVEVAGNGQEAVDKLKDPVNAGEFDLILMDIQMPVLDGYKAAKLLKEMREVSDIPVVAMTADTVGDARQKCFDSGMVDMISKPIEPDDLYRKVAKWVREKRNIKADVVKSSSVSSKPEIKDSDEKIIIKDINVEEGIRKFAHRWDFFKRLLERFYTDHINFIDELLIVMEEEDKESVARKLHSFKGITGAISSVKLYPLAVELEKAFKEKSASFDSKLEEVKEELIKLLNELKNNEHLDIN